MEHMATLALLAFSSFKDLKTKTVNIYITLLFSIWGIVCHMLFGRLSLLDIFGGICVGLMVLGASFLTGDAIGKGDALVIMSTGTLLGGYDTMVLVFIALFLCGIHAFFLLVFKNTGKKQEIPFAPFLLVAFVVYMVLK